MTATVPVVEELLETLGLIRRHTRSRVGRPWPADRLSGAQLELLRHVRRNPDCSVASAAQDLGLAANTVSTLVGVLVTDGLIVREPDPADRRVARLNLTTEARRRVESWRDQRAAVVADAFAGLDESERTMIGAALPALDRLARALRPEGVE